MPVQTGPEPGSLSQAISYAKFEKYEANTANEGYSKNLKIPIDLAWIDPAWSTCTPGIYGSWDPPRGPTAAQNMVAPTPAQPAMDLSATAAPEAGIAPTHIPAAPTPPPKDSANGPLQPGSPTVGDPGSESRTTQPNGNNDPAWFIGQAKNASEGLNAGDSPTPASKQTKISIQETKIVLRSLRQNMIHLEFPALLRQPVAATTTIAIMERKPQIWTSIRKTHQIVPKVLRGPLDYLCHSIL